MIYNRWYDKHSDLKSLMVLLESIDEDKIELIAQDFLQIITSKYRDRFDKVIKEMSENPPPSYNRWYDKNYTLHTCIEFFKTLNEEEKSELISTFALSLLSFIENVDNV